jgi:hypothetical protein
MKCLYTRQVIHNGIRSEVTCKQCLPCRLRRQNEWMTKLWLEMYGMESATGRPSASFVTFTYTDDCLPAQMSQMKRDLQLFFKRYRTNTGRKIRYFCIGELGPTTQRMHAHAIIFGHEITSKSPVWFNSTKKNVHYIDGLLNDLWKAYPVREDGSTPTAKEASTEGVTLQQCGRVLAAPVTLSSMRYVARYGLKEEKRGDHLFSLYSKSPAIGVPGALKLNENLKKRMASGQSVGSITHLQTRSPRGAIVPMFLDFRLKGFVNSGLPHREQEDLLISSEFLRAYGSPVGKTINYGRIEDQIAEGYQL